MQGYTFHLNLSADAIKGGTGDATYDGSLVRPDLGIHMPRTGTWVIHQPSTGGSGAVVELYGSLTGAAWSLVKSHTLNCLTMSRINICVKRAIRIR